MRRVLLLVIACAAGVLLPATAGARNLYWVTSNGNPNAPTSTIDAADVTGVAGTHTLLTRAANTGDVASDGDHIYFATDSGIGRARLDGSAPDANFITAFVNGPIATDGSYVYWVYSPNLSTSSIGRASIDGSHVDPSFISQIPQGLSHPINALTVDAGHIYWSAVNQPSCPKDGNVATGAISRANINGTGVDPTFQCVTDFAQGVYSDGVHLFATIVQLGSTSETEIVQEENLDGSSPRTITTFSNDSGGNYLGTSGLAAGNGYVFWLADQIPSGSTAHVDSIGRVALNGSGLNQAFIPLSSGSAGLAIDPLSISGTVYGLACGDSSCKRSPLAGANVLVKGTSSGQPVSLSVKSGADGSWAAVVPPGSYVAGPSQNGTTIDGTGFTPEQTGSLTVTDQPIRGLDFAACAVDPAAVPSARDVAGRRRARAGARSATPLQCQSVYRFDVSARIPQKVIADPSLQAHFNVTPFPSHNGYNQSNHGSWTALFAHNAALRRFLGLATEFPDCFSLHDIEHLSESKATIEWYSWIKGGSLGSFSVPVTYNQDKGHVNVAAAPTVHYATITKRFHWLLHEQGRNPKSGFCQQSARVPMLLLPVGGADMPSQVGDQNSFTLLVAWGIPFNPLGSTVFPESTTLSAALAKLGHVGAKLFSAYNSLNPAAKFVLDLAVSVALESAGIKAIELGAHIFAKWEARSLFAASLARSLEQYAALRELAHKVTVAREYAGFVVGSVGEHDHYPVMGAVIRAHFRIAKYLPVPSSSAGNRVPQDTSVALSVASTRFPTISVRVSRWSYPATASTGPAGGQPFGYRGFTLLPWASNPFSNPKVENSSLQNGFASNPPFTFADALRTGNSYSSGAKAVNNVLADTSQLPRVADAFRTGTLASDFTAQQAEAPDPTCDPSSNAAGTRNTICWLFNDARP